MSQKNLNPFSIFQINKINLLIIKSQLILQVLLRKFGSFRSLNLVTIFITVVILSIVLIKYVIISPSLDANFLAFGLVVGYKNRRFNAKVSKTYEAIIDCWEVLNLSNPLGGRTSFQKYQESLVTLSCFQVKLDNLKICYNRKVLTVKEIKKVLDLPWYLTCYETRTIESFIIKWGSHSTGKYLYKNESI
jgi:hypothetical protein